MIYGWTPLSNFLDRQKSLFYFFLMDVEIVEVTQISVKRYHGHCKVKRNNTRKLTDYKRGERYLFPTNSHCWKKTKTKYLVKRPYLTCQRVRLSKLLKEIHVVVGFEQSNYVEKRNIILLSNINKRRVRY